MKYRLAIARKVQLFPSDWFEVNTLICEGIDQLCKDDEFLLRNGADLHGKRPEAEQRLKDWLSKHGTPRTLAMWERQVKQTIVAWSAYVKAQLNNETVGGGVDVVSVAPPKLSWFELAKRFFQSMIAAWFKSS